MLILLLFVSFTNVFPFKMCIIIKENIILFSIMSSSKKSSTSTKKLFSFLSCSFLLMEIFIEASLGYMKAIYFIN
jgi:hypothetical protein